MNKKLPTGNGRLDRTVEQIVPTGADLFPSQAPGTGPVQQDTQATTPAHTRFIPGPPNRLGYGGGGDSPAMIKTNDEIREETRTHEFHTHLSHHGPPSPLEPRYNTLYDTLRTNKSGWRYYSDDVVTVSFTPTAGTVKTPVNGSINAPGSQNRVMQYPGGIQMYMVIRTFSYCPEVATGTGALEFRFADSGGQQIPLGVFLASTGGGLINTTAICPTPIADTGLQAYGNLLCIGQGAGGTLGVCVAQLGISYVYLLPDPAFNGYKPITGIGGDK
jgi:hypothetical protein